MSVRPTPGSQARSAQAESAEAKWVKRNRLWRRRWRSLSGYRVVDVETRETLLIWADSTAIPRIGETILISREPNAQEYFRVRDVVWEFNLSDGISQLRQLVVKVAKDAGVSGSTERES